MSKDQMYKNEPRAFRLSVAKVERCPGREHVGSSKYVVAVDIQQHAVTQNFRHDGGNVGYFRGRVKNRPLNLLKL